MRLVIHMGPHKTGSTYIQNTLARSAPALRAAGWLYPDLVQDGMAGHHALAHGYTRYFKSAGAAAQAMQTSVDEARAGADNIVLSSEGFCRWTPQKLMQLAGLFGAAEVDVVYVLRDPVQLIYSYWGEEVKQGHTMDFADRFLQILCAPASHRLFNALLDLGPFLEHPKIRLFAVPYHALEAEGIDLAAHIVDSVLRVPSRNFSLRPARDNASLPIEMTEFLRLITLIHAKTKPRVGSDLRKAFLDMCSDEDRQGIIAMMQNAAARAKREVLFSRDDRNLPRIERQLIEALEGHWTHPLSGHLFPREDRVLTYYSTIDLWRNQRIRRAAKDALQRIETRLSARPAKSSV